MNNPLSGCAASPSLTLRVGGGRPQRTQAKRRMRGLAALARGHWSGLCASHRQTAF